MPVTFATEAGVLVFSQIPDSNPTLLTALIAGFTGCLGLQAWVIKYLLVEHRKSLEKLTATVAILAGQHVQKESGISE